MTSGLYSITNTKTGRVYIGRSSNIEKRLITHRSELRGNRHNNKALQDDWNLYGEACFVSIIEKVGSPKASDEAEMIDNHSDNCYNINSGGAVIRKQFVLESGEVEVIEKLIDRGYAKTEIGVLRKMLRDTYQKETGKEPLRDEE